MTAVIEPVAVVPIAPVVPAIGELPVARPLDNPFTTGSSPITVATPSCCCSCCCCCLVTVATTMAYMASASGAQSRRGGRPDAYVGIGGTLSVLALPLGFLAAYLVGQVLLEPVAIVGTFVVVMGVSFWGGMVLLGEDGLTAACRALAVTVGASMAFAVEVFAALFTMFLIELLFPAGIVLGAKWGRGSEPAAAEEVPMWTDVRPAHESLPDADVPWSPEEPEADRTWFLDRPRRPRRPPTPRKDWHPLPKGEQDEQGEEGDDGGGAPGPGPAS